MKYWYINLKSITLSERGHAPKTTIVGFHLCKMSKKGNFIETESRSMVASDRDTLCSGEWLQMSSWEIFREMEYI